MNTSDRHRVLLIALAAGGIAGACYVLWPPATADLAAQTARANVASDAGPTSWWTGWFGGLSLPSYSALSPMLMAWLGVAVCGALCILLTSMAASMLLRQAPRPAAGTLAVTGAVTANAIDGRITFALGVMFAVWALVAVRSNALLAAVLAALSFLGSPLAGLFLGIIFLAVAVTLPAYRKHSLVAAASLALLAVAMQILFPGTGTMPFSIWAVLSSAVGGVAVLVAVRDRTVRATVLLTFCGLAVLAVFPGAIGDNLTRLFWIGAFPAVVAYGRLVNGLRGRNRLVAAALIAAIWPVWDVSSQVVKSWDRSVTAKYYDSLAHELHRQQDLAGALAVGERVEVLDVATHWDAAYLTDFALARGWDRQADHAENLIFYQDKPLTPAAYQSWLDQLAVGWVAVPSAKLDYASRDEGRLVTSGLPYLTLAWSDPDWRLYRVNSPTLLVENATIGVVGPDVVRFDAAAPGRLKSRIRYSPYLTLRRTDSSSAARTCVQDDAGWAGLLVQVAGSYELTTTFDPVARLRRDSPNC